MTTPPRTTTPTTIAGGAPGDALTVRHLRVAGTQREIGRALAAAAEAAHGVAAAPKPVADPVMEAVRRRWFEVNHPHHHARGLGIAEHFGVDPHDTSVAWDWLNTYEVPAGCSAAFHPGTATKDGHGVLARNFDFPTGTFGEITGVGRRPGERPLAADPWVVELHPTDGYASITVGIMDLMGAMDGINEAGLAVALLADNETPEPEPTGSPHVGLSEQQVVRYLLDRCATVDEARAALLWAKHYYFFTPCHFLVADRSGAAFVWEHSPRRNREVAVTAGEATHGRLVCTNHLLHRWPDSPELAAEDGPDGTAARTYDRWRTLGDAAAHPALVDRDELLAQLRGVAFVAPAEGARTFWQALYDVDEAAAELRFWLRDEAGESTYSAPRRFALGG